MAVITVVLGLGYVNTPLIKLGGVRCTFPLIIVATAGLLLVNVTVVPLLTVAVGVISPLLLYCLVPKAVKLIVGVGVAGIAVTFKVESVGNGW